MISHLVKMVILVEKITQNNYVFFMPHAFNQNEHSFDQCVHFSQVEPFEKP
jgi:hypothetical protein